MPINNQTSANDYSQTNTLIVAPPSRKFQIMVANAAIFIQFSDAGSDSRMPQSQAWLPEQFFLPGFYNRSDVTGPGRYCNGVRFRSAVAGSPAQVTILPS